MKRSLQRIAVVCACTLFLSAGASRAGNQYTESFTTTTFKDVVNTTADWNTSAGELRLFPFVPSLVGSYDTPGFARGVAVAGDLAFVADLAAGLQIIDITNPASPILVGSCDTPGNAFNVVVAGNLAFVADYSSGLTFVDITYPASPTLLGSFDTPGLARGVAVAGELVFVADMAAGLQIIDIFNPVYPGVFPTLVGSYDTPGNAYAVAVAGDLAVVADYGSGLQFIDITNPASPALVGSYDTPGFVRTVAVEGDVVFAADADYGLQVIDITNPALPTLVGNYDTPGNAYAVAVAGDVAFVADYGSGLHILDITNPAVPTLVGGYDTPGNAWGVAVAGDLASVADDASGLQVVRVSHPVTSPTLVGTYNTPGSANGVTVAGDLAFVADGSSGLQIISITNSATPTLVGTYNTPGYAYGVAVAGDLAFVVDGSSGLQIISITNSATPTFVGSYDTPGNALSVAVAGDLAFVADWLSGLQIIDITNPASPALVGTYDTPWSANGATVAGDLAFVADFAGGLQIINIANPASPALVGSYDTPGTAYDVTVAGDLAFVADYAAGLQIINIVNPASPTLVGTYDTPEYALDIAVVGNFAFVADDISGLQIIDITNPASPTLAGTYDSLRAFGVAVAGDLAFVADYTAGLRAIRVFQHEVDPTRNIGRSLALDGTSGTITRARLSSTQTAGVSWEVSANNGTNWQTITPDNAWNTLVSPGSDLQWRSMHTWAPGLNPTVSDLHLAWFYDCAVIGAISDIPNDQGGRVYVDVSRSGYDFADVLTNPVTQYGIYRRVDNTALVAAVEARAVVDARGAHEGSPLPGVETAWLDGTQYVLRSSSAAAATFPTGTWALVATIPATQSDDYLAEVTTTVDSSSTGPNYSVFVVTTHTTTPSVWFTGPPDSGYSVDNIAPAVPANFAIAYNTGSGNTLAWDGSPDTDFQYFCVYRSSDPNFTPSPGTLVHATIANGWVDPDHDGGLIYYKVTATDFAGNESAPTSGGTITGVGGSVIPRTFALYPNVPNPFNPTTIIRYDVPQSGSAVSLEIYDVSGRLVKTLVDGRQSAGAKSVTWDGHDGAGRPVASGVYFYRLTAPNYTKTHKMVLMK